MRYEEIKAWKETDFKRPTGARHETFKKMVAVLEREVPRFGRPSKLSRADQLLMALMYWREYRTQFHIAGSYAISEATVCRTINKVEEALMLPNIAHCLHNCDLSSGAVSGNWRWSW